MATDTSEKGLEALIVRYMTGTDGFPPIAPVGTGGGPTTDVAAKPTTAFGGSGYADLQAVCGERVVQAVCGGHGICHDQRGAEAKRAVIPPRHCFTGTLTQLAAVPP